MPHVVRAFPLRGSVADLQAFAQALAGLRAVDAGRFYRHYGVERESWHLQFTDHGPWVIAVTELADPTGRRRATPMRTRRSTCGSSRRSRH